MKWSGFVEAVNEELATNNVADCDISFIDIAGTDELEDLSIQIIGNELQVL
jgi:hypothetical protein